MWVQSPAVFLPGNSHEQRSLASGSPRGCRESDMTEQTHIYICTHTYRKSWVSLKKDNSRFPDCNLQHVWPCGEHLPSNAHWTNQSVCHSLPTAPSTLTCHIHCLQRDIQLTCPTSSLANLTQDKYLIQSQPIYWQVIEHVFLCLDNLT